MRVQTMTGDKLPLDDPCDDWSGQNIPKPEKKPVDTAKESPYT